MRHSTGDACSQSENLDSVFEQLPAADGSTDTASKGSASQAGDLAAPLTYHSKTVASIQTPAKSEPTASQPIRPGDVFEGQHANYTILSKLGSGGMGAVFLAETQSTPCNGPTDANAGSPTERVAIKFFKTGAGIEPGVLIKRELSALRALKHERIPAVRDWSISEPYAFVVLPYFAAGSLEDVLSRSGPISIPMAWQLLEHLLSALVVAHRASLLHLDIKPGNVLCAEDGFYLSDFGISQGSMAALFEGEACLGSPVYQSPEQRERRYKDFDVRSDLWGVGFTLWTALTGMEADATRSLRLQNTGRMYELPSPVLFRSDIPERLEHMLMPLLCTDRALRPGSAAELLSEIKSSASKSESSRARISSTWTDPESAHPEGRAALAGVMDPLWRTILADQRVQGFFAEYRNGECLVQEGEETYDAFVLLRGAVAVSRGGREIAVEEREGAFLGEVNALTGARRTATLTACGDVLTLCFNPAEFEQFVASNPAIAVRLLKTMASRMHDQAQYKDGIVA
ncbi:MAG: protein kinase domain-containing protein [Candidatus Sumerlaeaceae bacterium]